MTNLDDYKSIHFGDVKVGDRVVFPKAVQVDCSKGFVPRTKTYFVAAQITKVMDTQFIAQAIIEPHQIFRVRKSNGLTIGTRPQLQFYEIGHKQRDYSGNVVNIVEDQTELVMQLTAHNNKVKQLKARFDAADWNTTNMSDDDVELIEKVLKIVEEK